MEASRLDSTVGDTGIVVPDVLIGDQLSAGSLRNPLADDQVYTKLKRNKHFEAKPSVIHFAGFTLNTVQQRVIKLVNVGKITKRVHILPATTTHFSILYDKRGRVPPGMCEEIVVQFMPTEWRYYYDCIRIHSEDENILVPIHAYPSVAQISAPLKLSHTERNAPAGPFGPGDVPGYFPTKVDFGICMLCKRVERVVPIRNDTGASFEFSIDVLHSHPDLDVQPSRGTVPAHGVAEVIISYTPTRMATVQLVLEVNVSQFSFKPTRCLVLGSSGPGQEKQKAMDTVRHSLILAGREDLLGTLMDYSTPPELREGRADLTLVHDEAKGFKEKVERIKAARIPGAPIVMHRAEPPAKMEEEMIDGLRFPEQLRTRAATQHVLGQVVGKLSYKELRKQMEESGDVNVEGKEILDQKAKANKSIQWYEEERMQPGGFLDVEEEYGEECASQVAEFKFGNELVMREEYDRAKQVKWFPAIGDDPPKAEELASVEERREARRVARSRNTRARLRAAPATEADALRRVEHVLGRVPPLEPTFDQYLNDAWTVRKEVTEAFRREVHVLIVRNRVKRRLAAIRHKLDLVGGASAQAVEAILSAESAPPTAQGDGRDKNDSMGLSRIKENKVVSYTFPLYRDGNFRDRGVVKVSQADVIEDWDFVDLRVPQTAALLQYIAQPLVPTPVQVPLEPHRALRGGAYDELGVRGARGSAEPPASAARPGSALQPPPEGEEGEAEKAPPAPETLPMPRCCLEPPQDSPPISRALASTRGPEEGRAQRAVYDPPVGLDETATDFALRPFPRIVGDAALASTSGLQASERGNRHKKAIFGQLIENILVAEPEAPGMNTLRSMRNGNGDIAPRLSSKWLPRRELPRVLHTELPRPMMGSDAADGMSEGEEDANDPDAVPEPSVVIPPPSAASIRAEFTLPPLGEEAVAAVADDAAAAVPPPVTDPAEPTQVGIGLDPMGLDLRVPLNARALHQRDLELEVCDQRRVLESRLREALQEQGKLIPGDGHVIPIEPSIREPSRLDWIMSKLPEQEQFNATMTFGE